MDPEHYQSFDDILRSYLLAEQFVLSRGYVDEICWQERNSMDDLTESRFLSECAWVILSGGMSYSVVNSLFDRFSECFLNWSSASSIVLHSSKCFNSAFRIFGNPKKLYAILEIAEIVNEEGFNKVLQNIERYQVEYLQKLPFVGPITSYHLAKNIGLNISKPDRHLQRIATACGYECSLELCSDISDHVGEKESVVDLILWRFATINANYLNHFSATIPITSSSVLSSKHV